MLVRKQFASTSTIILKGGPPFSSLHVFTDVTVRGSFPFTTKISWSIIQHIHWYFFLPMFRAQLLFTIHILYVSCIHYMNIKYLHIARFLYEVSHTWLGCWIFFNTFQWVWAFHVTLKWPCLKIGTLCCFWMDICSLGSSWAALTH